jgi:hypothetical protein
VAILLSREGLPEPETQGKLASGAAE